MTIGRRNANGDVVLPDGTILEVVWSGSIVHPVTGVKGGLMEYPHRDVPGSDVEAPDDDRPIPPSSHVTVSCRRCHKEKTCPPWVARRHPYCSRRCAGVDLAERRRRLTT